MWLDIHHVTLLLTNLVTLRVNAQAACESPWFGPFCKYKCHCTDYAICLGSGECPDNKCFPGYFGPACQYVDLLSMTNNPATPSFVRDRNDMTCNTEQNETSIDITLTKASPFSWFRIVVDDMNRLQNFTLSVNHKPGGCFHQRNFVLDLDTIDVACYTLENLKVLTIEGLIVSSICSVYISGGRNVALRQKTLQSSDYEDSHDADRAVDGNKNTSYFDATCTHTLAEEKPSWSLIYDRQQIIMTVKIFNRDTVPERLDTFTLVTYGENHEAVENYTDKTGIKNVYEVKLTSRKPITSLQVFASDHLVMKNRILTICELETFGETVCPDGTYGLWCEKRCRCKVEEICNMVTGICAPACRYGYYGFNCSSQCSEQCRGGSCNYRLGTCAGCVPGYYGSLCEKQCDAGSFGSECIFACSKFCSDVCHHETGNCTCVLKYRGLQCTECPDSMYGQFCNNTCSEACVEKICNMHTGECVSCNGNLAGPFCDACPHGFFGTLCSEKCSEHCANKTCNEKTGECDRCINGYTGKQCRNSPDDGVYFAIMVLLVLPFLATLALMIFCLMKKPNAEHPAEGFTAPGVEVIPKA